MLPSRTTRQSYHSRISKALEYELKQRKSDLRCQWQESLPFVIAVSNIDAIVYGYSNITSDTHDAGDDSCPLAEAASESRAHYGLRRLVKVKVGSHGRPAKNLQQENEIERTRKRIIYHPGTTHEDGESVWWTLRPQSAATKRHSHSLWRARHTVAE